MRLLQPQTWSFNGHTYSVSLWVEGNAVVGMTNVTTKAGVVVLPPRKMLGDYVANGLAKVGLPANCDGCKKRRRLLNNAHHKVKKMVGRIIG